jgi:hypothetical protein
LIGGRDKLSVTGGHPRAKLIALEAEIELHETGPIFFIESDRIDQSGDVFAVVRRLAADWAKRSAGGQETDASIAIRLGPYAAGPGGPYDEWRRIKITTLPSDVVERLDDLVAFVVRGG